MRLGQLTEGLCPNVGKISPRACGRRSDANNAPKAACAGAAASKLARKREQFWRIPVKQSSEASSPEQGVQESEGYGWVLTDESSQLAAIWGIPL